ncbi:hypothetical protein D1BOALGB6SA_4169 [Olavius sp. associated proteobacterium Delta 1]|nr:hypothetical protein D1BOALGB6SA_4169 [Olavius sp. associated proteobacterium Delta 1]
MLTALVWSLIKVNPLLPSESERYSIFNCVEMIGRYWKIVPVKVKYFQTVPNETKS